MGSYWSNFSLLVLAETGFEGITKGEKEEHSLGILKENWVGLVLA